MLSPGWTMEKKYDALVAEQQAQKLWHEQNVYAFDPQRGPVYSIDTPPPTVSGSLHIGHIFSYTQTDVIARYKRLCGHAVFYPFGFDDNGLPTERFVEKQRGISANMVGRPAFIKACLEETATVEKKFEELWKKIGLSVDWKMCYSTIDERTRTISQASFIDLYKKGFVYRKEEPALYDTIYRTSVAQADLEDVEKETMFNDIVFASEGAELIIGTTRPELLASCVALLYNPEDARYQKLKNKKARVPLYGYEVPIIADEKVQIEKGTGLVMCCTFGDKTDIEWFKKHALPYRQSIGFDGKFLECTGPLAGLKVAQARTKILELLKEQGLLRNQKLITHAVSVYERSKNEIEYVMLPQWFLSILPHKQAILKAADTINWYPAFMKTRFVDWVENLQWDWCLSRQRSFGIPFPAWHNPSTGQVMLPEEHFLPVDPQEQKFPGEIPADQILVPDTDVMDTWNTSSLTPYICQAMAEQNDFIPMSMRPQAHDIIRTWAFYTIIKSWMHQGTVPWRDIVISGHVLSSAQEKISKSRGNEPFSPENLLKNYPSDVIRYWTASGTLGYDSAFSETKLKIGQKLLIKLWNAALFAHEHTKNIQPHMLVKEQLGAVNQWILHRVNATFKSYTSHFEQYEFGLALQSIEQFFWQDLCDNYIELVKDQLFNPDKYPAGEVAGTKATLHGVTLRVVQMFAPFIPHITEIIFQELYQGNVNSDSLHVTRFTEIQAEHNYNESVAQVTHLLALVARARKLKSDHALSLKTDLRQCTIVGTESDLGQLKTLEVVLKGVINAQEILYETSQNAVSSLQERDGIWYATLCVDEAA